MSWLESTDATARDLARLLARGGETSEEDLDAALSARTAMLDLANAVHRDLTGPSGLGHLLRAGSSDIYLPALMGHLLDQRPRTAPRRPLTDALSRPQASTAGSLWAQVARHALVASRDWASSDPGSRPSGAQAWTAVAANAALVEAVGLLEPALSTAAAAAGRRDVAEQLDVAARSGLAGVAASIREVAARGEQPPLLDVAPSPSSRLVMVRGLSAVPAATDRVTHLTGASASLSPVDVQRLARALASTSLCTAWLLSATLGHPAPPERLEVLEGLTHHARLLARAADRPGRTESIYPSDPRPLRQAHVITSFLEPLKQDAQRAVRGIGHAARRDATGISTATPGREAATLLEVARSLAGATTRLDEVAQRELKARRWLVPRWREDGSELAWVKPAKGAPTPPLVTGLRIAAHHATQLAKAVAVVVPPRPLHIVQLEHAARVAHQGMPGAEALSAVLADRRASLRRPPTPALPQPQRSAVRTTRSDEDLSR